MPTSDAGFTKEVIEIHVLLTRSLSGGGILRGLLLPFH